MRPLLSHLVIPAVVVALAVGATSAQSSIMGGDPPHRLAIPEHDFTGPSQPFIAIASDGTQFVVYSARPEFGYGKRVYVLRSVDGGDTFDVWSELSHSFQTYSYELPLCEVVGRGTANERLVVSFYSTTRQLKVAHTDPFLTTPVWTEQAAITLSGTGAFPYLQGYDLATSDDGVTAIGVAAVFEVANDEFEWYWAASPSVGDPFGPEQLLHQAQLNVDAFTGVGVAAAFGETGGAQRAHVVMSIGYNDVGEQIRQGELLRTSAPGFGHLGGFAPAILLASRDYEMQFISLAAQPDGDDLLLVAADDEFDLYGSEDGGSSWSPVTLPVSNQAGMTRANVRYAMGQFVLLAHDPSLRFMDFRPDGALTGTWTGRELMRTVAGLPQGSADLADDPTRPGQTAIVTLMGYVGWDTRLWYNATWRGAPGYGVLEAHGRLSVPGRDIDSAPAIGDLDGDGLREVVVTSLDWDGLFSRLIAFRTDGSQITVEISPTSAASAPALFDIDGDGDLEIFVGTTDGRVEGFDHDLQRLPGWPVDLGAPGDVHVSVGPVTGYAHGEVVAAHAGAIHVLSQFGRPRDGWPWQPPNGTVTGRAAIGDVDGDGATEIVAAFTPGVVVLARDGSLQHALFGPFEPASGVTLVDLDLDGDLEIACPMTDGTVALVHHGGGTYHPAFPLASGTGAPASAITVADIMVAGSPLLCFTSGDQVFAVAPDGSSLPGWPVTLPPGTTGPLTEPIIGRVARPGIDRPQLIVGSGDGSVHVINPDGSTPRDWPHLLGESPVMPAALSDTDQDGNVEMVIATGRYLYILDMGVERLPGATRNWAQAGHDRARSGCADCAPATPTAVDPGAATSIGMVDYAGAWPNPTASRTSFAFSLPAAARVELTVYDVRGRRVRNLLRGEQAAGAHAIDWDARDQDGRPVATGAYLGRLTVTRGGLSETSTRVISVLR